MVVMSDMNARVGCYTSVWDEVLGGMERKCATTVGDGYCSAAVSTTSGSLTHGFHTRESTSAYTWECRGRGLRSIIDYFLIRMEARKQMLMSR